MADKAVIYIHGQGGKALDSEYFKPLFSEYDVLGFDYRSENPWDAEPEFKEYFDSLSKQYVSITVLASSLGAYYLLISGVCNLIEKAFFVSPIVNMEMLIKDMMHRSEVSEDELKEKETISTSSGETLSWKYLEWVRSHPIIWNVPTHILYGEYDHFQSLRTIEVFAETVHADLTIMPGGEHWFHTDEQNEFRWNWLERCI